MAHILLLILALYVLFTAVSLRPHTAEAAELDSIYIRVPISPERYSQWLASPLRHSREFGDWSKMNGQMGDDYHEDLYDWDDMTNGELVEIRKNDMASSDWEDDWNTRPYINYDRSRGVFTYAQLLYDENLINFTNDLSAFRSMADFKDTDEPGFIVIYPLLWDSGYTVILEIDKGSAVFLTEDTAAPEFKSFITKKLTSTSAANWKRRRRASEANALTTASYRQTYP